MAGEPGGGGRKEGSPPKSRSRHMKRSHALGIAIACGIILFILAAFATFSVEADLSPEPGVTYPYTTTYAVLIPEGKPISIGGTEIIVLASGDEMLMKIGEKTEKFTVGETRTVSERQAVFRTLGIAIYATSYRLQATYRGKTGGLADFYLVISTSREVPSFLIGRVIPADVHARAI